MPYLKFQTKNGTREVSVWWGAHSAAAVDLLGAGGLDAEGLDNDAGEGKHSDTTVLDLGLAGVEHVGVAAHAEGVEAEVADSGSVERLRWKFQD